jgi:hypothetical protein
MAASGCGDGPIVYQCLINREILFTDFINAKDRWRGVQGRYNGAGLYINFTEYERHSSYTEYFERKMRWTVEDVNFIALQKEIEKLWE